MVLVLVWCDGSVCDDVRVATGLDKEAWSFLCNWDSTSRTFETKYNALAVGLRPHQDYSLRAVSVDEWGAPSLFLCLSPLPLFVLGVSSCSLLHFPFVYCLV